MLFGNVLRWQTEYLGRQLPGAARPRRLPPQGQAARPPGRAGDGGLLRAAGHRLHRRGVPDGRRQQAPRLQGGAQRHRGASRPAPSTTSTSGSSPGPPSRFARRGRGRAATALGACAQLRRARPPGEVCAFCRLVERAGGTPSRAPPPVPVELGPTRPRAPRLSRAFAAGDQVLLIDRKKRRYLVTLQAGGEFHSHAGFVAHDELIGARRGHHGPRRPAAPTYPAFRPTLSDFVLKMPRGAQVIYPKDLGPILMLADIFPGARVLESGVGSGALSMTLLRAGADVIGYELREDFAARAQENVARSSAPTSLDRYRGRGARLLRGHRRDRPRPRRARPARAVAGRASTPSRRCGPAASSSPTRPSIIQVVAAPRGARRRARFALAETIEVLQPRLAHRGHRRCAPTTAWSPTPASSPTPACCRQPSLTVRPMNPLDLARAWSLAGRRPPSAATGSGSSTRVAVVDRAARSASSSALALLPARRSTRTDPEPAARRLAHRRSAVLSPARSLGQALGLRRRHPAAAASRRRAARHGRLASPARCAGVRRRRCVARVAAAARRWPTCPGWPAAQARDVAVARTHRRRLPAAARRHRRRCAARRRRRLPRRSSTRLRPAPDARARRPARPA